MFKTKKFDFKTITTFILALMLSLSMLALVACNKNDADDKSSSSSSSSGGSTSITDYQTLANGDFEFGTDEKTTYPYNSSSKISWQRSNDSLRTSSDSSKYSSGIIDTDDEAYNKIAKNSGFTVLSGEGDDAVYFNPRTPYYYGLVKDSYAYSKDVANKDKLPTTGSKVLMIHNATSKSGVGTAQKFTSSTDISVGVDKYSLVEVWVLTHDLKTEISRSDFGAYVKLINTVDTEKASYVVKNINTDGAWARISIYVEGSSLRTSTYKLVLGLGFGSSTVTDEYVEGFAYFDNVTVKDISKADFQAAQAVSKDNVSILEKANGEALDNVYEYKNQPIVTDVAGTTFTANGEKADAYSNDKAEFNHLQYTVSYNVPNTAISSLYANGKFNQNYIYADENYGKDFETNQDKFIGSNQFSQIKADCGNIANPLGDSAVTDYMILKERGSLTFTTEDRTIADQKAELISFWLNAKVLGGQRAVSIELIDKGSAASPVEVKSAMLNNVSTVGYSDAANNDWVKINLYISNFVGDGNARTYALNFNFGPTEQTTDAFILPQGYALFTGYTTTALNEEQYKSVNASSDYSHMSELGADVLSSVDTEEKTDSYAFNYSSYDKLNISNKLSTSVIGYTGVVAGNKIVGGENEIFAQDNTKAGIFNTEYLDSYSEFDAEEKAAIANLEKDGENKYLQAIAIKNTDATAYGYIGKQGTFSASNTTQITVKLKVYGDAKAYVYLIDGEQLGGFNVLGLSAKKWTFDEETKETKETDEFSFDTDKTQYVQTVTASECGEGWAEVNFIVTAGITDISYRVEVWNGARDGSDNSQGLVVIDNIETVTPNEKALILKANANGDVAEEISYKQKPTKVTYTDEDGNEQVKYAQYNSKVIFSNYKATNTIIATHATIDAQTESNETTETPDDDHDHDHQNDDSTSFNWALQITSIVIAAVLLVALVAALVRMVIKNRKRKIKVENTFYNRNSRDEVNIKIAKNKQARKEAEALKRLEEQQQLKAEEEARQRAEKEALRLAEEQAKQDAQERARIAREEQQKALELEQQQLQQQQENAQSYDYDNMENNIETEKEQGEAVNEGEKTEQ